MTKAACIGECMIELRQTTGTGLARGYGGDTLNTAVYLSRLGVQTDYITALGDDPFSDEMVAGWNAEGVGTGHVARLPGKLPGLYVIQTDAAGERRFYHWRENSAARMLDGPAGDRKHSGCAGGIRSGLFLGNHIVALRRERTAAFDGSAWARAEKFGPDRVRHQFSGARLA